MSSKSPEPATGATLPESGAQARRRPRNRKQQILIAARDLFVERGYQNVTMAEVAGRVGITPGALYRHFPSKSVLLEEVMRENFAWMDAPIRRVEFSAMTEEVIATFAGRPFLSDLWMHELRYLPETARRDLRRRMRVWNESLVPAIRERRPNLDSGQGELLSWAAQSLMSASGRRAMRTAQPVRLAAVRAGFEAIVAAELVPTGDPLEIAPSTLAPRSMRERLLTIASDQFGRNGFQDTSMADIGAAADVTAQNVYLYFASKSDLLQAVLDRAASALWIALSQALTTSAAPDEALRKVVSSYIPLSQTWARILEDLRGEHALGVPAMATQREYISEWAALLLRIFPDLSERRARVRVQLALLLISDLYRNPRISASSSFAQNLEALVLALLFDGRDSPG